MTVTSHLKSLQALELAVRKGSFKSAADALGITPAAVGQRIRSLEDFLGTELLHRSPSGVQPSRELGFALADLHTAFSALNRVTETLDFQRTSEIHIVANTDWAELWLLPRLTKFQLEHLNIEFCINGLGDVPVRLSSPDLWISDDGDEGELLFLDLLVPVTGPDNTRRLAEFDSVNQMEGMPLLHLKQQIDDDACPGWDDWFKTFGHRQSGTERGVKYNNARLALDAVKQNVGFLVCGLSFMLQDLKDGSIVHPFPYAQHIVSPHPYRLTLRRGAEKQSQLKKFVVWLRGEADKTQRQLDTMKK